MATTPYTKTHDEHYRYRGTWDREPEGVCRIRIFEADGRPPVVVCTELDENPSTSVTNMAEILAAEIIATHFPHRFDFPEPCAWIEHYAAREDRRRRVQGKADYDRVTFADEGRRSDILTRSKGNMVNCGRLR